MDELDPLMLAIFNGESKKDRWDATETWSKNYNRVAHKPVSQMSIKEIRQHQRNNNFGAAGAFQLIPSTLDWFAKVNKLTGDEVFDEKLQKKAYEFLLNSKPEFKKFANAKTDEEAEKYLKGAGKAISQIWASVANPETGLSYYAKNGKDKASVNWKTMSQALRDYRKYKNGTLTDADNGALLAPATNKQPSANSNAKQTTSIRLPNGQEVVGIPLDWIKDEAGKQNVLAKINKKTGRNYAYDDIFKSLIGKAIKQGGVAPKPIGDKLPAGAIQPSPIDSEELAFNELGNKARGGNLPAMIGYAIGRTGDAYNKLLTGGKKAEEHSLKDTIIKAVPMIAGGLATGASIARSASIPGAISKALLYMSPDLVPAITSALDEYAPEAMRDISTGLEHFNRQKSTGNRAVDIGAGVLGGLGGTAREVAKLGVGKLPKGLASSLVERIKREQGANIGKLAKQELAQAGAGLAGGLGATTLVEEYGDPKFAPLAGIAGGLTAGAGLNVADKMRGKSPNTRLGSTQSHTNRILSGDLVDEIVKAVDNPEFKSYTTEAGTPEVVRSNIMGKRSALEGLAGELDSKHNLDITKKLSADVDALKGAEMFGGGTLNDYLRADRQRLVADRVREVETETLNALQKQAKNTYRGAMEGLYADIPERILNKTIDDFVNKSVEQETNRLRNERIQERDNWLAQYDNSFNYFAEPYLNQYASNIRGLYPTINESQARGMAKDWLENNTALMDNIRRRMPQEFRNGRNPNIDIDNIVVDDAFKAQARQRAEDVINPVREYSKTQHHYGEPGHDTAISYSVREFLKDKKHDPTLSDDTRAILDEWQKIVENRDTNADPDRRGTYINNLDTYLTRFNSFKNELLNGNIPGTNRRIENATAPAQAVGIMEDFNNEMFARNGVVNEFTQYLGTEGNYASKLKEAYKREQDFKREQTEAFKENILPENYLQNVITRLKSGRFAGGEHLIDALYNKDPALAQDFTRILYARLIQKAVGDTDLGYSYSSKDLERIAKKLGGVFNNKEHPNYEPMREVLDLIDRANGNSNASQLYNEKIRNISANSSMFSDIHQSPSSIKDSGASVSPSTIFSPTLSAISGTLAKAYDKMFNQSLSKSILKLMNEPDNFKENYVDTMGALPATSTQLLKLLYNIYGSAIGTSLAEQPERPFDE